MARVCQLFSGSSGNAILISSKGKNILVDVGVSAKRCEQSLMALGILPKDINAVFVTHEHRDHCCGVRVFSSRNNVPVYSSYDCINAMAEQEIVNDKISLNPFDERLVIDDIEVLAFHQSHDSADCLGYRFNLANQRSVSICTDTGYVTDEAKSVMNGSDLVFLESNHEISMVEAGPYPYYLKKRILGPEGHLSNFACGEYMKELAKSGTTRFVLSHLSRENNMPDIARQNAVTALSEINYRENVDYRLFVSPPENRGGAIAL